MKLSNIKFVAHTLTHTLTHTYPHMGSFTVADVKEFNA